MRMFEQQENHQACYFVCICFNILMSAVEVFVFECSMREVNCHLSQIC